MTDQTKQENKAEEPLANDGEAVESEQKKEKLTIVEKWNRLRERRLQPTIEKITIEAEKRIFNRPMEGLIAACVYMAKQSNLSMDDLAEKIAVYAKSQKDLKSFSQGDIRASIESITAVYTMIGEDVGKSTILKKLAPLKNKSDADLIATLNLAHSLTNSLSDSVKVPEDLVAELKSKFLV